MAHPSAVEQLRLGDHVCWTCDGDDDWLDAMARLVDAGVRRGEKVLYLTESLLPAALVAGLSARGLNADGALASGQLVVRRAREVYLAGGGFDPDATLRTLTRHIRQAREEGWAGLRIIGDMAWALSPAPGVDQLDRYEAGANRLFLEGGAMAVCQYDQRLFSASELRRAAIAHPGSTSVTVNGRWRPLLRIHRTAPSGLRLVGEADMSNRRALASVLETLVTEHALRDEAIVIDMTELAFADGAAVGLILRAARKAPGGVRLVGCAPPVASLVSLLGAEAVAGLTMDGTPPGANGAAG